VEISLWARTGYERSTTRGVEWGYGSPNQRGGCRLAAALLHVRGVVELQGHGQLDGATSR